MKKHVFNLIAGLANIFIESAIPCSILGFGLLILCIFSYSLEKLIGGICLFTTGVFSFLVILYISKGKNKLARFLREKKILERHFEE